MVQRRSGLVVALVVGLLLSGVCSHGHTSPDWAFGPIQPAISPDGRRVAFSWQGTIAVLPMEGGPLKRLTTGPGFDIEPTWSPDGRRILYIESANFDLGRLRGVRVEDGSSWDPPATVRCRGAMYFDPNGERVLGRFSLRGSPVGLGWLNLESAEVEPITDEGSLLGSSRWPFCLSEDGRWLSYVTHRDRPGEQTGTQGPYADLWRLDLLGDAEEPSHLGTWPARIYGMAEDFRAGGVIVVTDRGTSHNDLWRVPFDQPLRAATRLTFGSADEEGPALDREGGQLVYTDNRGGLTALMARNLTSGITKPVVPEAVDPGRPAGTLRLEVRVPQGDAPVARLSIRRRGGKFHSPPGALYRVHGGRMHFYFRDSVEWALPAGDYEIVAMRGPEFRTREAQVRVAPDEVIAVTLDLERWAAPGDSGWFSGENHIHANYGYGSWYVTPEALLLQCQGEGLNVCNAVVANSDGDAVFDREFFLGVPDPRSGPRTILYWNEEFRSTIWGHLTLGSLDRLIEPIFTGFLGTTHPEDSPTNAEIAERVQSIGGTVSYTHPASNPDDLYDRPYTAKGLPVDAALGRVDTMDVGGFGYEASTRLWYRLLNCGFRLPAAAGTDCFLNRIRSSPPGWARAYVMLPGGLDYYRWQEMQKQGRSFISNGPQLEFSVGEFEIGDVVELDGPTTVTIRGRALADSSLDRLELIHDGRVVATVAADDSRESTSLEMDRPWELNQSGWLALRVGGRAPTYRGVGRLWAHTNPIYFEVGGLRQPADDDARYFLDWIDRLDRQLAERNRYGSDDARTSVSRRLDKARAVYRELVRGRE